MELNGNSYGENGRDSSGRFSKGHPGFKRKRAPEYQMQTRQILWNFFQEKVMELPEIFKALSPNNKARTVLTIAEFFLPKQREIFLETDIPTSSIDFSSWDESDLRMLVELQKKYATNDNGRS